MKLTFDVKIQENAGTYGTLIGMSREQEKSFIAKLDSRWRNNGKAVLNTGDILKQHLESAETVEQAILAAFFAGQKAEQAKGLNNTLTNSIFSSLFNAGPRPSMWP